WSSTPPSFDRAQERRYAGDVREIYHVTSLAALDAARATGVLTPVTLGSDGFVHASYLHQLVPVANLIFRGASDLRILELDRGALGVPTVDEPPNPPGPGIEATDLFPHIQGPIPMDAVRAEYPFSEVNDGFVLPDVLRALQASEEREFHALLEAYAWSDHPEGPKLKFAETHRNAHRTSGHWLFSRGAISAFHQVLDSDELWIAHRGGLRLHVIDNDGTYAMHALGLSVDRGEVPVISIQAGAWQAAELPPGEPYAFGTNVCAPAFTFEKSFVLGARAALAAQFPQYRELIERLTLA
ncbi:MAG: cupin domain-containing protein, partial [Myxococcota bacterium]